jgi:hypothetical protein
MSERITRTDLERARKCHEIALRRYGMLSPQDELHLDIGSKTYGNAYRIWVKKPGESGHYESPVIGSSGFLGMTAREAWDRLTMVTGVIYSSMDMVDRFERQADDS